LRSPEKTLLLRLATLTTEYSEGIRRNEDLIRI
jgi:hypothetical protein